MSNMPFASELEEFKHYVHLYRYDFCKLVYVLFPFGQPGHALEHFKPRKWQMREWDLMSKHLQNPETRYTPYKLVISTGNGSGKTAFGAITMLMLMYTHKLRGRLTANTKPQLTQVVWPEYDKWFRHARFSDMFFEKFGESIKSRDEKLHDQWQYSLFTWDATNPAAVSGLHNQGHAILYTFEEAPGIPAEIFKYAHGAFAATNTIKFWLVFGNSDDPDSKFEQLMADPGWRSLRIDTRTLEDVDKTFVETVLRECGGDEDADDFRIRVRGLPRKTNADAIINRARVMDAFDRVQDFDPRSVSTLPCVLTVDTAWTGGDYNTIWLHQGHYHKLVGAIKLSKENNDDHRVTFDFLRRLEKRYNVDAVLIDQAEGTTLKTYANDHGLYHWELVSFGSNPTDTLEPRNSEYANLRAQMYYLAAKDFNQGAPVLDIDPEIAQLVIEGEGGKTVKEIIIEQMGYTKGDRHKVSLKKLCESKKDLIKRVGKSPDFADGYVIYFARKITERLEGHATQSDDTIVTMYGGVGMKAEPGSMAIERPESMPDYSMGGLFGSVRY